MRDFMLITTTHTCDVCGAEATTNAETSLSAAHLLWQRIADALPPGWAHIALLEPRTDAEERQLYGDHVRVTAKLCPKHADKVTAVRNVFR